MNESAVIVAVVMTASGLFSGYLGRRILRGDVHLISGYRGQQDVDEQRLARANGRVALAVGALTILTGLAYPLAGIDADDQVAFWGCYTLAVCVLTAYAMVKSRAARTGARQ